MLDVACAYIRGSATLPCPTAFSYSTGTLYFPCFRDGRTAVEDVDWFYAHLHEVACPVEQAAQVAGDFSRAVFQWCAVWLADYGEKLGQGGVGGGCDLFFAP